MRASLSEHPYKCVQREAKEMMRLSIKRPASAACNCKARMKRHRSVSGCEPLLQHSATVCMCHYCATTDDAATVRLPMLPMPLPCHYHATTVPLPMP